MKRNKLLWVLLAVLLVITALSFPVTAATDSKERLNALSAKYDELEKQQLTLQKDIDKAKSDKAKQLATKQQLDNQIFGVREQISVLSEKITLLETSLEAKEAELLGQELRIFDGMELLKKRMRVLYTTGNATVLGLVLGADDFSEFLTRAQVASQVAKHDQKLIKEMQEELAAIEAVKAEIELTKTEVESSKQQMSSKQTQLGGQLAQTQDMIQDIEAQEAYYKANKSKVDKEMATAQSEIDAIYAALKSDGIYEGGAMLWPMAGFKTITSPYGPRWGDFHTGIDIARTNASGQGIYGKPILAAADGKVIFTAVTNRGYGIYAMVDHGGGISTIYGHQSGLKVKTGDSVKRGDVIGYVGSTGWSTGPHLHFEVRINGKHTAPLPYFQ